MKERLSNSEKLVELTNELPDFCAAILIGRKAERELSTRVGYARDLSLYFDYLISNHRDFAGKKKKSITASDMRNISPMDVDMFLTYFAESHSPSTVKRIKSAMSAMFNLLVDYMQILEYNPVKGAQKIKIPEKDFVIYLTRAEQEALLQTIKYGTGLTKRQLAYHSKFQKRDLAMVFLFLDTGIRVSEMQGLDMDDLDMDECSAIVRRKGGKLSKIYFSDESREYIADYIDERKATLPLYSGKDSPLFITLQGERLSVREIQTLVPKYVKAAIPGKEAHISPHKLRSTFAMDFYRASRDILTLQKRLGHRSLNVTNIYAKACQDEIRDTRNWRNA